MKGEYLEQLKKFVSNYDTSDDYYGWIIINPNMKVVIAEETLAEAIGIAIDKGQKANFIKTLEKLK